jgi:hypothetical protein
MRITAIEPLIVEVPTREPVKGVHGVTHVRSAASSLDRGVIRLGNWPGFAVEINPRATRVRGV